MRRRDAIKTIGALAGAAGAGPLISACGSEETPAQMPGIDTLVFLMMENRSYDHYLGSRTLVEGRAGDGLTTDMSNPNLAGDAVPLWPASAGTSDQCVLDPPHNWDASHAQWNDGLNDGFLTIHQNRHGDGATEALQYMLREHVPITHALADAYTVCDRWFCSVMGGTLPNRMYWHAGTANGADINSEVIEGAFRGVTTVNHRLDDVGVDWAYYFGDVPVLGFLENIDLEGRLRRFWYEFIDDAAAGRLPSVCYIDPSFAYNDDHPPHHPLLGQQLIAATYQALATSPQWERSLLVITYDEHGGFYDHVAPPTTVDINAGQGFDQLGFRVPTLVVGPYAKQDHVSSVIYDHTSPLKHLQGLYGLESLTMRVDAANDLSDCIDGARLQDGQPSEPIELPALDLDESILSGRCGAEARSIGYHHDILEWADSSGRFGDLDWRKIGRESVYGIAEYLEMHNLGRLRRGR